MSDGAKTALENLLTLSRQERAEIAERLLASLDDEPEEDQASIDASWAVEIERRIDAFHEGKIESVPGQEVMNELYAKYAGDIEAAQIAEVKRRIANRDESKMIPYEKAMKMARTRRKPTD